MTIIYYGYYSKVKISAKGMSKRMISGALHLIRDHYQCGLKRLFNLR